MRTSTIARTSVAITLSSEHEVSLELRHLGPNDEANQRAELLLLAHVVLRQMATLSKRSAGAGVYRVLRAVVRTLPALRRGEGELVRRSDRAGGGTKRIAADVELLPGGEHEVSYHDKGFGLFDSRTDQFAASAMVALVSHLVATRRTDAWYQTALQGALKGCAEVADEPWKYGSPRPQSRLAATIVTEAVETADSAHAAPTCRRLLRPSSRA